MGTQGSKGSFGNASGINNTVNFISSSGYPSSDSEKLKKTPTSSRMVIPMSGKHSLGVMEAIRSF